MFKNVRVWLLAAIVTVGCFTDVYAVNRLRGYEAPVISNELITLNVGFGDESDEQQALSQNPKEEVETQKRGEFDEDLSVEEEVEKKKGKNALSSEGQDAESVAVSRSSSQSIPSLSDAKKSIDDAMPDESAALRDQLFSGSLGTEVPIELLQSRGGVLPNLSLCYSSSATNGLCGVGWDFSIPYVAKSTKNGLSPDGGGVEYAYHGGGSLTLFNLMRMEHTLKSVPQTWRVLNELQVVVG